MQESIYIFAPLAVVCILVLIVILIFQKRKQNYTANYQNGVINQNKIDEFNKEIEILGCAYDVENDFFYSLLNCWQRRVGYCKLYDETAPAFNMIVDCEPIKFTYGGKRWLIELWKGQYGITTGAEIGIYNTDREDVVSGVFTGTFYDNITDNEMLNVSFVLRKNGNVLIKRKGHHWWLTAFKLGVFSYPEELTMVSKITFKDYGMLIAFVNALVEMGYTDKEYKRWRNTVTIYFKTPHSKQPESDNELSNTIVQKINENNCKLFEIVTGEYENSLDKILFIKAMVPNLYNSLLKSLYSKEFFRAFDSIVYLLPYSASKPEKLIPISSMNDDQIKPVTVNSMKDDQRNQSSINPIKQNKCQPISKCSTEDDECQQYQDV